MPEATLAGGQAPRYTIRRAEALPSESAAWDGPAWSRAKTLTVSRFHPRGSAHRPATQTRLLHDNHALAIIFRVDDRYVLARGTKYQSPTHRESCVEFFARPRADCGYFNFEWNAIGTLLLWYIDRPRRPDGTFEEYVEVPEDLARTIAVGASLMEPIRDEHPGPLVWTVSARVPLALFEAFTGPLGTLSGQEWRANFYKCADGSSHPHWGYWADIGERLDFHQPDRFGEIVFE
jgi:Carbohydrate-binding family 9